MDGAETSSSHSAAEACAVRRVHRASIKTALTSRRVAAVCVKEQAVRQSRAVVGSDLGGSSKYSNKDLEN